MNTITNTTATTIVRPESPAPQPESSREDLTLSAVELSQNFIEAGDQPSIFGEKDGNLSWFELRDLAEARPGSTVIDLLTDHFRGIEQLDGESDVSLRDLEATFGERSDLTGPQRLGQVLSKADLEGNTRFSDLRLSEGLRLDLAGQDLTGSDLLLADFTRSNLRGSRLDGANLRGAVFNSADLSNASLQGVDLDSAKLLDVDLRGADLTGVKNLDQARLTGALVDETTRFDADVDISRLGLTRLDANGNPILQDTEQLQTLRAMGQISGDDKVQNLALTGSGGEPVTVDTAGGDDRVIVSSRDQSIALSAGAGNDTIRVEGSGLEATIDLGKGDDELFVDGALGEGFGPVVITPKEVNVLGGEGQDTLTLDGALEDWVETRLEDGTREFRRGRPSTGDPFQDLILGAGRQAVVRVGSDVETVRFEADLEPAAPPPTFHDLLGQISFPTKPYGS